MRYLSVCSGIEAASVAWHPLGWSPVAFSEIEPFPRAVLAHHYPDVPNWGDLNQFKGWPDADVDLLVGGTPCQSFSVAGLRAGLADPRGNLALVYLAVAERYRPLWLVWENVPGVLSSGGGRDFGSFLGALGQLGYGFAYRVLDAQYFGLAQRRKRVFVVAHLGDWRRAAAVLFERESLSGHPAPRREAREDVAGTLSSRTSAGGGLGTDFDLAGDLIAPTLDARAGRSGETSFATSSGLVPERARALTAKNQRLDSETETFVPIAFSAKDHGADASDVSPTLRAGGHADSHANGGVMPAIAFGWQNSESQGDSASEDVTPTLDKSKTPAVAIDCYNGSVDGDTTLTLRKGNGNELGGVPAMQRGMQVRRLTPRECERLQGFPDDYTLIEYRGKPAADGPRYKALGNSMAVPCMAWIGRRIALVESVLSSQRERRLSHGLRSRAGAEGNRRSGNQLKE